MAQSEEFGWQFPTAYKQYPRHHAEGLEARWPSCSELSIVPLSNQLKLYYTYEMLI